MALNKAPSIERDVIEPMEDLSNKLKDLLLSLGGFIKKSGGYFGILFAPSILFILVFHFEIYDLFFEKNGLYNSSIITGTTALILGYWLYKSALFANKHDKLNHVIKDNLLSFITLSFLIFDISTNFVVFNNEMGFTKEQFYAEKWLIIVFVTLDFILGLKAGYYYYKNDYVNESSSQEELNLEENIESNEFSQEVDDNNDIVKNDEDSDETSYNNKKMSKFLFWTVILMILIMSGFYIYNGSS